jgi:tetratricopeptide (TPR) repeat protein
MAKRSARIVGTVFGPDSLPLAEASDRSIDEDIKRAIAEKRIADAQNLIMAASDAVDRGSKKARRLAIQLNNVAVSLCMAHDLASALTLFGRAIDLDDKYANAHAGLAEVLSRMRRFEDALGHIDRALTLGPRTAARLYFRGLLLLHLGHNEDANKTFREACRLDP